MSILALTSNTLVTAASGNIEYDGQFFGTDSNASRAQLQRITQGTAVSPTSGTSVDFTGIPSWVDKITVMWSVLTASGSSSFLIQLGTSGGVVSTGYNASGTGLGASVLVTTASTAGFITRNARTLAATYSGVLHILNLTGNTWVGNGSMASASATEGANFSGGIANLGGTLDRVRITTVNGTDTFSAGSINIMYEG
jgi:hypothetical protein